MQINIEKIGMRNFKTALSVFLCIIILKLFSVNYPFYACIAAVISMQSSMFDSFNVGKHRMIGTFIGALMGLVFALIQPGNALLCSLGIILIIYICNFISKKKSTTIACIVFLAIMTNLMDRAPLTYSINRLLETFLGIIISVLVNYFVFPPKHLDDLNEMKEDIIITTSKMLKNKIYDNISLNLYDLRKKIFLFDKHLDSYCLEVNYLKNNEVAIKNLNSALKLCQNIYSHLYTINSINSPCNLNLNNQLQLENLYNIKIKNTCYNNTDETIVYNYHINELVKILKTLKNK
ncbi:FUSC family protein [Clostridium brassicae]|uniref:Aromatic acid exporter family protein n=1 Tax=Clostridium brassicae TaxID=2999072 RepID=A0ABT4D5D5_9CLOT|nr:aromatic acid exporter family protein [Clostridium brassicae]MCY6957504.1 aromatic acid exporter family protein [Clostridium brassicae]